MSSPHAILEWRQLSKLKSTYTDALPDYVNPQTQRVHTSYALAATTTGRLSSSEPNLQNIPVRTEAGRKIRRAFIAAPGHKLMSADYSQIELRLLAAYRRHSAAASQAFADGLDIHAMTASEMFGVPVKGMPAEVRRRAKAINFGIIYGISAFGLANQLGIPREEAGAYIKQIFRALSRHPRLYGRDQGLLPRAWLCETIFGRKCHYPRIKASNPSERAFNERAAINAPTPGLRRRHHPPRHGADGCGVGAGRSCRRRCCCRCMTNWSSRCPTPRSRRRSRWCSNVMADAPHPAVQLSVPCRSSQGGAELGRGALSELFRSPGSPCRSRACCSRSRSGRSSRGRFGHVHYGKAAAILGDPCAGSAIGRAGPDADR